MNNQNKKDDVAEKPEAGTRDPKGKQALLEETPHGRHRPPNSEDELGDPLEHKTSQEKVRREQGHKNHRSNTN